ncbi:MAG TPA: DUF1573 domain-containing protein [Flavipsychrobacter sp.]|nr:DUF1573 domain-containing protein [Flavipsychrobacter sp.]
MRLIILGSLIFFATACSNSKTHAGKTDKIDSLAAITWDNTTVDLGNIKKGDTASFAFVLHSTGTHPLILQKVDAVCGCTFVKQSNKPVLPNEKDTIRGALYTSKLDAGPTEKHVYALTNAQNNRFFVLRIKANIIN